MEKYKPWQKPAVDTKGVAPTANTNKRKCWLIINIINAVNIPGTYWLSVQLLRLRNQSRKSSN